MQMGEIEMYVHSSKSNITLIAALLSVCFSQPAFSLILVNNTPDIVRGFVQSYDKNNKEKRKIFNYNQLKITPSLLRIVQHALQEKSV